MAYDFQLRLDCLMYKHMANKPEWKKLWDLVRMILLLSHGQASVERSFSVNREIEVENMKEQTLVAQRIINDQVSYVGGVTNVSVTKDILLSASCARQKYRSFLEDKKKEKSCNVDRRGRPFWKRLMN